MGDSVDRSAEVYANALRAMSLAERLRVSEDLRAQAWEAKVRRVRELHPEWSEAEVQQQVSEIFLRASASAD
jgi:hypothetical protein